MTKRAVLNARVSGDDRGNDGRNLAGQLDMCREYAPSEVEETDLECGLTIRAAVAAGGVARVKGAATVLPSLSSMATSPLLRPGECGTAV